MSFAQAKGNKKENLPHSLLHLSCLKHTGLTVMKAQRYPYIFRGAKGLSFQLQIVGSNSCFLTIDLLFTVEKSVRNFYNN